MLFDSPLVDRRQRTDRARGSSELAKIAGTEEHARVAASSALVDVNELRLQVGQLIDALHFEIGQARRRALKRLLGFGHRGLGLLELSRLDVAIDFPLSQIADERARLTGQPLGLTL